MATVLPFTGLRPPAELAALVAAPPYDVISSKAARQLAENNPASFLHINKPEIDLPIETDAYSDAVYEQGRLNMERFLAEKILIRDETTAFYCYRQTLETENDLQHSQTGIVALVSADDYDNDIIRKHEQTRPDKETDRVKHMQAVRAQTGPVFLTYRADKKLEDIVDASCQGKPDIDFVSEQVRHQLWPVTETSLLEDISALFTSIPTLFIADGHHRSAAAVRYRDICREQNSKHQGDEAYNYFMAVLFPHDQLNILGYHRVVKDLAGLNAQDLLDALAELYDITPSKTNPMPESQGQFGLYLEGQWYRLKLKSPEAADPNDVGSLDVTILHKTVLSPILGIGDERTDNRIDFIGGVAGQSAMEEAVNSGDFAVAFACYPVNIEQLMAIAEQNLPMPPKSTWFEPKLKSGLVVHYLG